VLVADAVMVDILRKSWKEDVYVDFLDIDGTDELRNEDASVVRLRWLVCLKE